MNFSITKLFKRFFGQGGFIADVITLMTGNVLSRVLAIAAIPIVSRLYGPEEFGVLALFALVNVVVATIACGSYESAIILQKDERNASHLLVACILIATVVSLLEFVVIGYWADEIAAVLSAGELSPWLKLSPMVVWIMAVSNACRFWLTRRKQFKTISTSEVLTTGSNVSAQILLGSVYKLGAPGLIIGQIVGQITYLLVLGGMAARGHRSIATNFSFQRMKELLIRFKNFPLYDTWSNMLNVISRETPILVLGVFFTTSVVGLYSLAFRMISMPVHLTTGSIMRVFLPKAKEAHDDDRLGEVSLSLFKRLAEVSFVPVLMLIVVAQELITFILGDAWIESGPYVQFLSIWALMRFIGAPLTQLFTVLERLRHRLAYQMVQVGVRVAGLCVGGFMDDPVLAVALASLGGAAVSFSNSLWLLHKVGNTVMSVLSIVAREILLSVPYVVLIVGVKYFFDSELILLSVFAVASAGFFIFNARGLLSRP